MAGRALGLLVIALCSLLPAVASAGPNEHVARMSRLLVDGAPTALDYDAALTCAEEELSCAAEVAWTLPAHAEPRQAVLYLWQGEVQSLTVDGRVTAYTTDDGSDENAWHLGELLRVEFTLPATTEPLQVELETTLVMTHRGPRCGMGMMIPLAEMRHITQSKVDYLVDLDAMDGWPQGDPPPVFIEEENVEITLDVPRQWKLERLDWSFERHGSRRHATSKRGRLRVGATDRRWAHGPALAVGARMRGRDARPWLRGAWEFSRVPLLVHSAAIESDFRRMVLVPSTEIGTAGWFILPSLSAGLGVPVRVYPEVRPGARAWGGLNFPVVSIVGGYDVFPRMAGHRTEHVGHVGLQFSI